MEPAIVPTIVKSVGKIAFFVQFDKSFDTCVDVEEFEGEFDSSVVIGNVFGRELPRSILTIKGKLSVRNQDGENFTRQVEEFEKVYSRMSQGTMHLHPEDRGTVSEFLYERLDMSPIVQTPACVDVCGVEGVESRVATPEYIQSRPLVVGACSPLPAVMTRKEQSSRKPRDDNSLKPAPNQGRYWCSTKSDITVPTPCMVLRSGHLKPMREFNTSSL